MNKTEFLSELKHKLDFLSDEEKEKTITYYSEIIDDRIENGMSEATAVAQMESTKTIAEKLMLVEGTHKTTSEKVFDFIDTFFAKHGYLLLLALLIFSFPVWSPIVLGLLTFICAVFLLLFAVIVVGAISSVVALGIAISFLTQSFLSALSALGVSMFCAGLTVLVTIGTVKLINKTSNFCKRVCKNIKERSEKRRNSK